MRASPVALPFLVLPLLVLPLLAGCLGQGGRTGPGDVPPDALGAMYTDMPAEQVASCFARAIGGRVQPNGARLLVMSPMPQGATYDVGANATGGDYPTEVIVRGRQQATEQQRAAACFATRPPAA